MAFDKNKYFELLNEAENNPNIAGVFVSKKRNSGIEAANLEYSSIKIKQGKSVSIMCKEENEGYIEAKLNQLKKLHNLDCIAVPIYSKRITDMIINKEPRFLGWEIKLK